MSLPIFPDLEFDSVIETYIADANSIRASLLAYFDFRDGAVPVWAGGYDFVSGGVTWQGVGRSGFMIEVTGLDDSSNLSASDIQFVLSGTDIGLMAAFAESDRGDYVGQLVGLYMQFCDVNWQPLCSPLAVRAGIMGQLSGTRQNDEKGSGTRTISLSASNIFFGRSSPRPRYLTDSDQQRLYPGDTFCAFVTSSLERVVEVPWR